MFGLSPARISQLREWMRKEWESFQAEAKADELRQLAVG